MSSQKIAFAKDVSFIAISKYSGILIGIIISMVLSRMLSPADFGIIAIANVFIVFFTLFTDMGIGTAVIQRRDLSEEDIADISGWTIWMGLFLGGIFCLSAWPISLFYEQRTLFPVCLILSLQLAFSSFNIVPNALLLKEKKFKIIAIRNLAIQVSCGIIAIILAFSGVGIYSLLVNSVIGGLLIFLVNEFYMKQKFHIFFPSIIPLKKIFSYSFFQFLSQLINYFGNNTSSLIMGKSMSVSALGYYQKASSLSNMPSSAITGVVSPVLFPYLSDLQDDLPRMFSVYKQINKILLTFSFPITVLLCICSKEIIYICFGSQWLSAVKCFSIMSFTVAIQISSVTIGSVFQACGRTDILFKVGLINTVLAIICCIIGNVVIRTIEGVATMGVLSSTWAAAFSTYIIYKKCFNESSLPYFKYALRPITYSIIIVFASAFFSKYLPLNVIISLLVKIVFWSLTLYAFLKYFTEYDPKHYLKIIANKLRNK